MHGTMHGVHACSTGTGTGSVRPGGAVPASAQCSAAALPPTPRTPPQSVLAGGRPCTSSHGRAATAAAPPSIAVLPPAACRPAAPAVAKRLGSRTGAGLGLASAQARCIPLYCPKQPAEFPKADHAPPARPAWDAYARTLTERTKTDPRQRAADVRERAGMAPDSSHHFPSLRHGPVRAPPAPPTPHAGGNSVPGLLSGAAWCAWCAMVPSVRWRVESGEGAGLGWRGRRGARWAMG